jgi:hypothetical protein
MKHLGLQEFEQSQNEKVKVGSKEFKDMRNKAALKI